MGKEPKLDWDTVKKWRCSTCGPSLTVPARPGPRALGSDEISVRKGHSCRIVVSDLVRKQPIWFCGTDRSEAGMAAFYDRLARKEAVKSGSP